MSGKGRVAVLLCIFLVFTSLGSSLNIVNSQDWEDVYSGIRYSHMNGEEVKFALSPTAAGLIKKAPSDEPVTILQSSDTPISPNLRSRLESNGFTVENVRSFRDLNSGLAPDNPGNIIIVPEDYPSAAIASAPLASATDSWVYVAGDRDIGEIVSKAENADRVVLAGDFPRDHYRQLKDVSDSEIIDSNRFNLSVKLTERFLEETEKNVNRAYLASGKFLEADYLEGDIPVLLSGTNLISEPIRDYLLKNPDHSLRSLILIGNEMTAVGQDIRDLNITQEGQETDGKYSVFVKYGTARGDSSQIYALSLFPIPQGDYSLEIGSVRYDPESEELYVTYRNTGKNRMYALNNIRIISEGESIGTVSDREPVFIGGQNEKTVTYSININSENYRNASAEFSSTYGESPSNLDTYLTEEGRFSPPVTVPVRIEKVEAGTNVSLDSVVYLKGADSFRLEFSNNGDEKAYVRATLRDLEVNGERKSFETELLSVKPGETGTAFVQVKLDRIDLKENERVEVVWNHGDSKDVQPVFEQDVRDLKAKSGGIIGSFTNNISGVKVAALIGLLALAFLGFRRRDDLLQRLPVS